MRCHDQRPSSRDYARSAGKLLMRACTLRPQALQTCFELQKMAGNEVFLNIHKYAGPGASPLHCTTSHHIQCNDEALDEDVFSAFPALRFDARLPRRPWHRWQHIYMVRRPRVHGWRYEPCTLLLQTPGSCERTA